MSHKVKSSLYFATMLLAIATYYTIEMNNSVEYSQLAENTTEQVSTDHTIN